MDFSGLGFGSQGRHSDQYKINMVSKQNFQIEYPDAALVCDMNQLK